MVQQRNIAIAVVLEHMPWSFADQRDIDPTRPTHGSVYQVSIDRRR